MRTHKELEGLANLPDSAPTDKYINALTLSGYAFDRHEGRKEPHWVELASRFVYFCTTRASTCPKHRYYLLLACCRCPFTLSGNGEGEHATHYDERSVLHSFTRRAVRCGHLGGSTRTLPTSGYLCAIPRPRASSASAWLSSEDLGHARDRIPLRSYAERYSSFYCCRFHPLTRNERFLIMLMRLSLTAFFASVMVSEGSEDGLPTIFG